MSRYSVRELLSFIFIFISFLGNQSVFAVQEGESSAFVVGVGNASEKENIPIYFEEVPFEPILMHSGLDSFLKLCRASSSISTATKKMLSDIRMDSNSIVSEEKSIDEKEDEVIAYLKKHKEIRIIYMELKKFKIFQEFDSFKKLVESFPESLECLGLPNSGLNAAKLQILIEKFSSAATGRPNPLRHLNFENNDLTEDELKSILENCSNLQYLNLAKNRIRFDVFNAEIGGLFTLLKETDKLKTLNLSASRLTLRAMDRISLSASIQELVLDEALIGVTENNYHVSHLSFSSIENEDAFQSTELPVAWGEPIVGLEPLELGQPLVWGEPIAGLEPLELGQPLVWGDAIAGLGQDLELQQPQNFLPPANFNTLHPHRPGLIKDRLSSWDNDNWVKNISMMRNLKVLSLRTMNCEFMTPGLVALLRKKLKNFEVIENTNELQRRDGTAMNVCSLVMTHKKADPSSQPSSSSSSSNPVFNTEDPAPSTPPSKQRSFTPPPLSRIR